MRDREEIKEWLSNALKSETNFQYQTVQQEFILETLLDIRDLLIKATKIKYMKNEINNFRHNAVSFKFTNGNTIDAIFDYGTYSDNYDMVGDGKSSVSEFTTFAKSSTVESNV